MRRCRLGQLSWKSRWLHCSQTLLGFAEPSGPKPACYAVQKQTFQSFRTLCSAGVAAAHQHEANTAAGREGRLIPAAAPMPPAQPLVGAAGTAECSSAVLPVLAAVLALVSGFCRVGCRQWLSSRSRECRQSNPGPDGDVSGCCRTS
jgi:hypothetical protein